MTRMNNANSSKSRLRNIDLAEQGWNAYLEQEPTAIDAYETRFWLADSRYWVVVLQVVMERTPVGNGSRSGARRGRGRAGFQRGR